MRHCALRRSTSNCGCFPLQLSIIASASPHLLLLLHPLSIFISRFPSFQSILFDSFDSIPSPSSHTSRSFSSFFILHSSSSQTWSISSPLPVFPSSRRLPPSQLLLLLASFCLSPAPHHPFHVQFLNKSTKKLNEKRNNREKKTTTTRVREV